MAKILLVDDSKTSRKFLRNILEADHHEVIAEATTGTEAIEKYKEFQPDIVTMDITMPELDGISALKEIMTYDPEAKVIMVTAAGQKNKLVEAIKYGAREYLTKPFDPEQIREGIQSVL